MSVPGLVETLAAALGFSLAALVLGDAALIAAEMLPVRSRRREASRRSMARFGGSLLVGFGAAAYIGVLLGLAHALRPASLLILWLLILALGRGVLAGWGRFFRARSTPRDPIFVGCAVVAAVLLVADAAAALTPPNAWDELAYHMPEARQIAETHTLHLQVESHFFYGNIPKLVEVLYAEGISVSGYALAHVLHLLVLCSFLVFVYGTLASLYGRRTGILAVVLLLLFDDLVENATTGYVDAAVASFEVGSVVALAAWVERRRSGDLVLATLLIGLALSAKYTAAATLVYLAAVFGVVSARRFGTRTTLRGAAALGGLLLVVCGFWYGKNAVLHGNPVYPLYFGHRGVSDAAYASLLRSIQEFEPRTIAGFVRVPERYGYLSEAHVFLALYLLPVALLARRATGFVRTLLIYALLYCVYWYFLASHVTRYLMPAVAAALVVFAITLVEVRGPLPRLVTIGAAAAAIGLGAPTIVTTAAANIRAVVKQKLHVSDWRYAVGLQSEASYLTGRFGCQYDAVAYAGSHLDANVVDDWNQWHAPNVAFYAPDLTFAPLSAPATTSGVAAALRKGDFRYLYVRERVRRAFLADRSDPSFAPYAAAHRAVERIALRGARVVWRESDCRIYRLAKHGA